MVLSLGSLSLLVARAPIQSYLILKSRFSRHPPYHCLTLTSAVPIETKTQSDQPETFEDMFGGLGVPEHVFLSASQGLLNFPKILISDHFAALFGFRPQGRLKINAVSLCV